MRALRCPNGIARRELFRRVLPHRLQHPQPRLAVIGRADDQQTLIDQMLQKIEWRIAGVGIQ